MNCVSHTPDSDMDADFHRYLTSSLKVIIVIAVIIIIILFQHISVLLHRFNSVLMNCDSFVYVYCPD